MTRYPVNLPEGLEAKMKAAAEKADMLPKEFIRQVLRDYISQTFPEDGT